MKNTIIATIATLATTFGFSQEVSEILESSAPHLVEFEVAPSTILVEPKQTFPVIETKKSPRTSFGYILMGISDSQIPSHINQTVPGIGIGYRVASGPSAIDVMGAANYRKYRTATGRNDTFRYIFPKVNYFHYLSPEKDNSFYAGGGLAWGGIKTVDSREFHGIIPNVTVGYELTRNSWVRTFTQLDISQAAIATSQKGKLPGPLAEISIGAGF